MAVGVVVMATVAVGVTFVGAAVGSSSPLPHAMSAKADTTIDPVTNGHLDIVERAAKIDLAGPREAHPA